MATPTQTQSLRLTASQKKRYLRSRGIRCPPCESDEIEGTGDRDTEADTCTNEVRCLACGASWTDIYKLHDVVLTARG